MTYQSDRFPAPVSCFRVKSRCNRWLAVAPDGPRTVTFVERQDESSGLILLPCEDGRYMLQLISTSDTELHQLVCQGSAADRLRMKNLREECAQDSELSKGDPWFLRRQGQRICVSCFYGNRDEDFYFSLEFDERGYVRVLNNSDDGYWTLDSNNLLLVGAQKASKRAVFLLIEYALVWKHARRPYWISRAPVRVNLRAHTGKYLCSAGSVVSAAAEAPCCCEEFLIDLNFPPLPPLWDSLREPAVHGEFLNSRSQSATNSIKAEMQQFLRERDALAYLSKCKMRTADGMFNLSAEADGKLSIVQLAEAQGHENFMLQVINQKCHPPKVSIMPCNNIKMSDEFCYVSTEPSSKVICNKVYRHKWEEYVLELANGSRLLIQSVHGGFVGSEANVGCGNISFSSRHLGGSRIEENISRRVCSCRLESLDDATIGAWRLRAHGDSLYTLVAATASRDHGDVYLFVDAGGRVLQSGEPGVHFPATASLFEIKPTTAACCIGATRQTVGLDAAVVGFTIKTVRKVNGKQRFLTAEPNGLLIASRVRASRWEIFRLVDIDATASIASPSQYICLPAAVNVNAPAALSSLNSPTPRGLAIPLISGERGWSLNTSGGIFLVTRESYSGRHAKHTMVGAIQSVKSLKMASKVAAAAVREGRCVPGRMPATLQKLCINEICLQASTGLLSSSVELGDLLSAACPEDLLAENCLGIPGDLFAKISHQWRARQHPKNSCKTLPCMLMQESGNLSENSGNVSRPPDDVTQQSSWENNVEGLHCHSCNHDGVLRMDPVVNPAHHRYLEVQYHAQNGLTQPTGFLWNLISFAGISVMSTALLFQFFASRNKRRNSRLIQ